MRRTANKDDDSYRKREQRRQSHIHTNIVQQHGRNSKTARDDTFSQCFRCLCVCCAFRIINSDRVSSVVSYLLVQGGKYTEHLTRGKSGKVSSLFSFLGSCCASPFYLWHNDAKVPPLNGNQKKKGTRAGSIDNFIILGKMSLNSQNDAAHDNNSNNITTKTYNVEKKKTVFLSCLRDVVYIFYKI